MILRKLCVSGDMAIGRENATFCLAFMHLNKNLGYFFDLNFFLHISHEKKDENTRSNYFYNRNLILYITTLFKRRKK